MHHNFCFYLFPYIVSSFAYLFVIVPIFYFLLVNCALFSILFKKFENPNKNVQLLILIGLKRRTKNIIFVIHFICHLFLEIPKNTLNSIDTQEKPYRGTFDYLLFFFLFSFWKIHNWLECLFFELCTESNDKFDIILILFCSCC